MHEKAPILKAYVREKLGSRFARRMRSTGKLPAVIYGHKADPIAVLLDTKEAIEHFTAGEKVFRLDFPGADNKDEMQMVLLKDLQFDYTGTGIVHVDMARVDLNEVIRTRVHVELTGEAKGLKAAGSILIHPTNELIIECRVRDIPETITLDISELDVNESITAAEVKLPLADMKLITDSHAIVAQIVEQRELVAAEESTVAAGDVTPEVIGEKERLEKAAAKDPKAAAKAGAKPAAAGAKPAAAGAKPAAAGAKPAAKK